MIHKVKSAWKNKEAIAMGVVMVSTIYVAFVINNLKARPRKRERYEAI